MQSLTSSVCDVQVCKRWRQVLPTCASIRLPDSAALSDDVKRVLLRQTEWDRVADLCFQGPACLPSVLALLGTRLDRLVGLRIGGCSGAWPGMGPCGQKEACVNDVGGRHCSSRERGDDKAVLMCALRRCSSLEVLELCAAVLKDPGDALRLAWAIDGGHCPLGLASIDDAKHASSSQPEKLRLLLPTLQQTATRSGALRLKRLQLPNNALGCRGVVSLAATLSQQGVLNLLDLSGNGMRVKGAAALAAALCAESGSAATLRTLRLRDNDLGPEGMMALACGLVPLRLLAELDLSANRLTASGATSLAGALTRCSTLTTLALNFNFLGEAGSAVLAPVLRAQTKLRNLDLSFNDMGPAGMRELVEGLSKAECLVDANGYIRREPVQVQLERLDFSKNTLGSQGANELFPLLHRGAASIVHLDLRFNGLGQQHAAMVKCQIPRADVLVLEEW